MATATLRSAHKLYVANLSWTVGHTDLKKFFNQFGSVNLATIIYDKDTGRSRNYGFVFFKSQESYNKALGADGQQLQGYKLRVQAAGNQESQ